MKTTVQVRLSPRPEQAVILRAHCQEYISTSNVVVAALDRDVLPDGGKGTRTKDFIAVLPSAGKTQALRAARFMWNRSFVLGVLPVLRKPICQWNGPNWRREGEPLVVPVSPGGKVQQISSRCAPLAQAGTPGWLRIKRKRGKWMAALASTLPEPEPTAGARILGGDLGSKVPAVVPSIGKGHRFVGTGRRQRAKRRQFYAHRKDLQKATPVRAVRQRQGKERRWRRASTHQRAQQLVSHAPEQGVGTLRMEQMEQRAGIRQRLSQRTARKSRGAIGRNRTAANARNNNRLIATWTVQQLATCSADTAERAGIAVDWVDPAPTSQRCPACCRLTTAADRH